MARGSRSATERASLVLALLLSLAACSHIGPSLPASPSTNTPPDQAKRFSGLVRPWPLPGDGGVRIETQDPTLSLVTRAFSRLGVPPEILRYKKDHRPIDPFRLSLVDRGLADPLALVRPDGLWPEISPDPTNADAEALLRWAGAKLDPYAASLSASPDSSRPGPTWTADLSKLPGPIASALRPTVEAASVASALVGQAFEDLSPEDRSRLRAGLLTGVLELPPDSDEAKSIVALWSRVDMGRLVRAAILCLRAMEETRSRLLSAPRGSMALPTDADGIAASIETPAGPIRVGGTGPSLHSGPALVSIDLGGNDLYDEPCSNDPASVCLILDVSGNDLYRSERSPGPGGGLLGVGIALDAGGNDTYVASAVALGSGALGVGVLVDEGGNDRYSADKLAQGVGEFGIGLLLDRSGDDQYGAAQLAQGVGMVAGAGMLVDEVGDDLYEADFHIKDHREKEGAWLSQAQGYGVGARDWASGGIGLLWDRAGNDRYVASYFAQGASYWYGLGLLLDEGGDDVYLARRYAQGAGIHAGIGILRDTSGNDSYLSWGVSQGCGHDLSVGILLDDSGNDAYTSQWLSQGAGNENGLGLLADLHGDDRYVGSSGDVQGWGNLSSEREAVSFGMLLDGAGDDSYGAGGRNDASWVRGSVGAGVDAPDAPLF